MQTSTTTGNTIGRRFSFSYTNVGAWSRLEYEADRDGKPGSTDIWMAVHQTYSSVEVHCYLTTSTSVAVTATIELVGKHRHQLVYVYRSQAPVPERDRNRPHEGSCTLQLVGRPVEEIGGDYYTDRHGRGRIVFDGFSKRCLGSLGQAQRAKYRALPGPLNDTDSGT
jgi:hypothetical protein